MDRFIHQVDHLDISWLIDASTRWSHVSLLSTRNVAFECLLAQIIKLRAQFPDNPIKIYVWTMLVDLHQMDSMNIACRLE